MTFSSSPGQWYATSSAALALLTATVSSSRDALVKYCAGRHSGTTSRRAWRRMLLSDIVYLGLPGRRAIPLRQRYASTDSGGRLAWYTIMNARPGTPNERTFAVNTPCLICGPVSSRLVQLDRCRAPQCNAAPLANAAPCAPLHLRAPHAVLSRADSHAHCARRGSSRTGAWIRWMPAAT
jgi:hypothetical protein